MDPRTNMTLRNVLVGMVIGAGIGIVFVAISDNTTFIGLGPAIAVAVAIPLSSPPQRLRFVVLAASITTLIALSIIYFIFIRERAASRVHRNGLRLSRGPSTKLPARFA